MKLQALGFALLATIVTSTAALADSAPAAPAKDTKTAPAKSTKTVPVKSNHPTSGPSTSTDPKSDPGAPATK